MKLNLHPKGIPKQEPLGADTPLKKGGVVVGMRKEGDKEKIYFVGDDCHLLCVGATRSGKYLSFGTRRRIHLLLRPQSRIVPLHR